MKYYISDGKEKFGPLSIEDLKSYSIDENTLIWYKGLEKWKYAKNVPEILQLIKENKQETKSDIPPLPAEKSKIKDNSLKYIAIALAIVLIAILGFEVLNKSDSENNNIKDTSEVGVEQLKKSDIINLLKDYYRADKDKNLNNYQSYYSYPIKNYFNYKNVSKSELAKTAEKSWLSTSFTKNTPDFGNLNFIFKDSIYIVNYPLTYEFTSNNNGIKYINTYDATIKLNNDGKIFYINNIRTSSTKFDNDLSFFKDYEGKYPENTIFNNENLISRLNSILGSNYNFMIKNWNRSSKIFLKNNSIYTYGCKSGECEDTNFAIILDLNKDELFVGFKHRSNVRQYNEKNGYSERLSYWYEMNKDIFETSN